jgi:hypothetical protein
MTWHDNYEKKGDHGFMGDKTYLAQLPIRMKHNETRIEGPSVSSGDPVRHRSVSCASSTPVCTITSEQPVAPGEVAALLACRAGELAAAPAWSRAREEAAPTDEDLATLVARLVRCPAWHLNASRGYGGVFCHGSDHVV